MESSFIVDDSVHSKVVDFLFAGTRHESAVVSLLAFFSSAPDLHPREGGAHNCFPTPAHIIRRQVNITTGTRY